MSRKNTILYLDGVSVSFDGFKAINELSLVLDPGDLWAAMSRSRDGEWNGDRIVGSLDDPPPCP